jgi:hypothetical protein
LLWRIREGACPQEEGEHEDRSYTSEELAACLFLPRRPLRRTPRRPFPPGAGGARRRVLHPGRVERCAPAAVVVLRQLQIKALAVHADGDVADAGPGVEPGPQRPERSVVGEHRTPGESDCCAEELAALVEHALLDDLVRPEQDGLRDIVSPRALEA